MKHLAVFRLSAMGDVAMTVPVVRALQAANPDLKITVISRPMFKPFFQDIPNVSFFAFDAKVRHKGFVGLLRFIWDIKQLKTDGFADLHNVLRSKIIRNVIRCFGVSVAYTDKARAEKKALTRNENKIFEPLKPIFERHLETFDRLGLTYDLAFALPKNKIPLNQKLINITGAKTIKWIGIAPFAQYKTKVYPLDLMQEIVATLANIQGIKVFLFGGGAKEKRILDQLAYHQKQVVNIVGEVSFNEELALISHLDVMLSMDSGNAHIAAMLGVRVVTLWGATHPYAGFLPFGQSMNDAICADRNLYPLLPTSIYGNKVVEGYEDAMRTILPDTIVKKVME